MNRASQYKVALNNCLQSAGPGGKGWNQMSVDPDGYTWFRFPQGIYCRFNWDPSQYYPIDEEEELGIRYYVVDDFGMLVRVYDHRCSISVFNWCKKDRLQ